MGLHTFIGHYPFSRHHHVFATGKCSRISYFIVSLFSTLYMKGVLILVLHHKDNKLLSIDRKIKSKD